MADESDDQLIIEIGARTDGFAASLKAAQSVASAAFSAIEQRGSQTAGLLASAFGHIGGNGLGMAALNHGLKLADANGSKLAGTLLKVQKSAHDAKGAAMDSLIQGELALIKRVQASGGLGTFASSLGDSARTALVTGVGAFAGFEALKFGLEEVSRAAKEAEAELARLVKIGDDARDLGVGSTFFQRFTDGSKALGLEADELKKVLESLKSASMISLGTGDEINPKSSAQEAIEAHIKAGNLAKGDGKAFDQAGTQEERLRAALDLLSKLQAKGAQLAEFDLGKKLFGEDFEAKLRTDSGLIEKLQAKVADMAAGKGANVIPPEQIAAAKALDAEMESLNERVKNALIPFHNDLRSWQQDELASTLQLKKVWVEIVEVFGKLWTWADKIKASIDGWDLGNASIFKNLNGWIKDHGLSMVPAGAQTMGPFLPAKNGRIESVEEARAHSDAPVLTVTKRRDDPSKPLPEEHKERAPKKEKDSDPIENYLNELKKATAAEEANAATLGMSAKAKQEALDLAKAQAIATEHNRTLTAEETAAIKGQADAYSAAKDKIDRFNKAQEQAKEKAQFFGTEFESAIEKMTLGSGKLSDVIGGIGKALEQAALKALILGEGPLAGMFGTAPAAGATGAASVGGLFGGIAKLFGFAEGGQIAGPGTGTSDSIVARVSAGEFVVNAKAAQDHLGLLHAINKGALPKFATGGQVGAISTPALGGSASSIGRGGDFKFSNHVTVNATGGTTTQNADLAKQVGAHVEAITRQTVIRELRNQMRPGNLLQGVGMR